MGNFPQYALVKLLFTIYLFAIYYFAVAFADFLIRILTMKLTKRCQFNGEVYEMEFPTMTASQYYDARAKWENGAMIQDAFSFLTPDEREFIMTGTPPHIWDKMFSEHGL